MYIIKPGAQAVQHIWEEKPHFDVLQLQDGTYTLESNSPYYEQEIEFVEIYEIYKRKIFCEDEHLIIFGFDGTLIEIAKEHLIEM